MGITAPAKRNVNYSETEEHKLKPHKLRNLRDHECVLVHCERGFRRVTLPPSNRMGTTVVLWQNGSPQNKPYFASQRLGPRENRELSLKDERAAEARAQSGAAWRASLKGASRCLSWVRVEFAPLLFFLCITQRCAPSNESVMDCFRKVGAV
jgi:hypothetical protein